MIRTTYEKYTRNVNTRDSHERLSILNLRTAFERFVFTVGTIPSEVADVNAAQTSAILAAKHVVRANDFV